MEPIKKTQSTKQEGTIPESNYTQFPNIVIDEYMRNLSGGAFKVLAAIVRSTIGWHKTRDRISQSQIMEKTGMVKNSVKNAVRELIEKGLIIETEGYTNNQASLYDLNIQVEEGQKLTPGEQDDSTVEYQKMTLQRVKNCTSRGSKIDPTKERKDRKKREEAIAPLFSQPLSSETDLPSKDSSLGQDHGGNGDRRSQDPVEVAYNQIYEGQFHILPNPDKEEFTKRRSLLRTWRSKGFTDSQLIGILKVALEDPWLKENFYLSTVVSHKQVDKILRKHPDILKTPEKQKPRDPCPVCGSTEVVAGSCGTCHFDLRGGDRKPESIKDWRLQAIWRGALQPRTEQEKADSEAWHQRRIAETEELKKPKTQLADVAA